MSSVVQGRLSACMKSHVVGLILSHESVLGRVYLSALIRHTVLLFNLNTKAILQDNNTVRTDGGEI